MKKIVLALLLGVGLLLFFGCETIATEIFGSSGSSGSSGNSGTSTSSTAASTTSSGTTASNQTADYINEAFRLTNAFRTGNEANYWNSDNRTKTSLVGKLGTLKLDADLCRAAEIRAKEIVKSFSHTRPDGRSCFSVFQDLSISYSRCGENIAAGNASGAATFTQWKEDDKDYSGQGHRRNMLGDFTKIGIARAYDANSRYKYYWVMVLSK